VVNEKAIKQQTSYDLYIFLIMLDTLLLRSSLHFTSLHLSTLHFLSLSYASLEIKYDITGIQFNNFVQWTHSNVYTQLHHLEWEDIEINVTLPM
jgi:hypothetical protein